MTDRGLLTGVRAATSCKQREVFLPLLKVLVHPFFWYWVHSWAPQSQRDMNYVEKVQTLAAGMKSWRQGTINVRKFQDRSLFDVNWKKQRTSDIFI